MSFFRGKPRKASSSSAVELVTVSTSVSVRRKAPFTLPESIDCLVGSFLPCRDFINYYRIDHRHHVLRAVALTAYPVAVPLYRQLDAFWSDPIDARKHQRTLRQAAYQVIVIAAVIDDIVLKHHQDDCPESLRFNIPKTLLPQVARWAGIEYKDEERKIEEKELLTPAALESQIRLRIDDINFKQPQIYDRVVKVIYVDGGINAIGWKMQPPIRTEYGAARDDLADLENVLYQMKPRLNKLKFAVAGINSLFPRTPRRLLPATSTDAADSEDILVASASPSVAKKTV